MTTIFDVILKRHEGSQKENSIIFYDEDRDTAIEEMKKYVDKNGFTINDKGHVFTIATLILKERESTGKVISETPYHEIFNTCTGKRK